MVHLTLHTRVRATPTVRHTRLWVRRADGETDKGANNKEFSKHARALAPRGMLLVEWDPDPARGEERATQCWYLLDPKKWNADHTHRAWRYHPEQLAKLQSERPPKKARKHVA